MNCRIIDCLDFVYGLDKLTPILMSVFMGSKMITNLWTNTTVREIVDGFVYNELEARGCWARFGKLTIQPEYQRNSFMPKRVAKKRSYRACSRAIRSGWLFQQSWRRQIRSPRRSAAYYQHRAICHRQIRGAGLTAWSSIFGMATDKQRSSWAADYWSTNAVALRAR